MAGVVLLHGFASTSFTWRHVAAALRDDGHEVATPDLGCAFATPVDAEGAVVVGHSAGCVTAVLSAGGARGLVLVSPVLDGRGGPPAIVRSALRTLPGSAALLRAGVRVAFDRAFRSASRSALAAEVLDGYRAPLLAPGAMEAIVAMEHAPDVRPQLAALTGDVPVHVVVGEHDRWATLLPSVPTTVIAGAGHLPHEERFDETTAAIRRALQAWGTPR